MTQRRSLWILCGLGFLTCAALVGSTAQASGKKSRPTDALARVELMEAGDDCSRVRECFAWFKLKVTNLSTEPLQVGTVFIDHPGTPASPIRFR